MELVKEGITKNKYLIKCNECYGEFKININDIKKETAYDTWCGFQVGHEIYYTVRCPYCNKQIKIDMSIVNSLRNQ